MVFHLGDNGLEAFLKIAPIAGACQKCAHIKAVDGGMGEDFGGFMVDDLTRQTFGDGGFANARITDQQRVVLAAAAEHLNATLYLGLTPDQGIDIALFGFDVEINAVFRQRGFLGLTRLGLGGFAMLFSTRNRAGLTIGWVFGDTVGDVVDGIIAGHILLLQEIGGVGFAFGKNRDQHVGAGNLSAARGLHMDGRALDHALEGGGRHGLGPLNIGDQGGEIIVDEIGKGFAQDNQIDRAGLHDAGGIGLINQREQKVLKRGEFMFAGVGKGQRAVDGLFEGGRK